MAVRELLPPEYFVQVLSEEWVNPNTESMQDATIVICPQLAIGADPDSWREDTIYNFYISNLSTRGLDVFINRGALNITVGEMSSVDEWWLALRLLEYAAQSPEDIVINDWKIERYPIGALREIFEGEFITEALREQTNIFFEGASLYGREYQFEGPILTFYFGPWLAQRIATHFRNGESLNELINFTHEVMRMTQYFNIKLNHLNIKAPACKVISIDGKEYQADIIQPGNYFVGKVDFLIFPDAKQRHHALPSEEFKEQLPKYFKEIDQLIWLDEHQFALVNISESDLDKFAKGVKHLCAPAGV